MPECLIQAKGSINNPLKCLRNLEMPGEAVQRKCFSATNAMDGRPVENLSKGRGRKIKSERDVDEEHKNASSLLYTLAAAAASRTSSPKTLVKQENHSSPDSQHNSNGVYREVSKSRRSVPSPNKARKVDYDNASLHSAVGMRDIESYDAFQQMVLGSKPEDKTTPKQGNQLHLMEAMMQRQRQLYEEYGHSNWMKMQRTDSNCLSKSKAKRYRWCVQKGQEPEVAESRASVVASQSSAINQSYDHAPPSNKKKMQPKRNQATNGPMHDKLYGTVFTGASKFRCRDCGDSFSTLLDLTVHMSKSGHYRDQNIAEMKGCVEASDSKFAKPKKRSIMELDEKESAEKVLKCLGCGHSFDSLQDLTVHMMKTKHYEDVPSLRLYSQKNEFCAAPSSNGMPSSSEDKPAAITNQPLSSNNSVYPDPVSEPLKVPGSYPDPAALGFMANPAFSNQLAGQPNFSNMLNVAALRLLGAFPPYMMQMPFPNAMAGYDMAYAAMAARMFLSSPWMGQIPGMNAGMFPPFLNPNAAMQQSIFSQSGHMSPVANDISVPAHSARSTSSSRGVHLSSPDGMSTPTGSIRDFDDTHKSPFLRCVQCGESFTSLQKMTDHMRETTHFPIAMTPPVDDTRRSSRCSSITDHAVRSSPRDATQSVATASPLEQLAKLARGKSLSEIVESNARSKTDAGSQHKRAHCSTSPDMRNARYSQQSPTAVLSNDRYIRPSSPHKGIESSVGGSDFIKSLESTIQSAISRVSQPCVSPTEQTIEPPRSTEHSQKSKKHHIMQSVLPPTSRVHRKSLPNQPMVLHDVSDTNKVKTLPDRPASDGEEYYRREGVINSQSSLASSGSPPLDLSNRFALRRKSPPLSPNRHSKSGHTEASVTKESPGESSCPTNARKRWEKKQMKSLSPVKKEGESAVITKENRMSSVATRNQIYATESDPIREMQKIVNSTNVSVASTENQMHRASLKRKLDSTLEGEKYRKSSVLSDLVRHDENEQVPALNPLMQMEHLVNLKIGSVNGAEKSGKKPNLAKPYLPAHHDSASNGTSPMSALLHLFQGTGGFQHLTGSVEFGVDTKKEPTNGQNLHAAQTRPKELDCYSRANRLNEKMAEIFSTLIRKGRNGAESSPQSSSLSTVQQIQLQAFFAYHHEKRDGDIPDADFESLSSECGISVVGIKKWVQDTKATLSERKECNFVKHLESGCSASFSCTSCASNAAQGLSARDFLRHLSIHMRDLRAEGYEENAVSDHNEEHRQEPKMKYKGEVHFKPLKTEDSASQFSLTAHVTDARVGPTASPELDAVAEKTRKRVDVIDESSIKVSG